MNVETIKFLIKIDYLEKKLTGEDKEIFVKLFYLFNECVRMLEEKEQQCKKQKETINKAIELLGNYKHYSTPDEKQNGDNEDLVNNAFDTLKEVSYE